MKRKVLFLLAALLLPAAASAYDACINGIYYNLVKKANLAEVTKGENAYSGNVTIPETVAYDGTTYYVKLIGEGAFSNVNLNSLTIPATIDSISSGFGSIENLYISDLASWCNIGFYHFYPNSHSWVEQRAWTANPIISAENLYVNNKKVTHLDIPEGVTAIKSFAFIKAHMVKSITVPSSVKSIGVDAFSGCDIESLYITNLRAWCDISFAGPSSNPLYSGENSKHFYLNGIEVKDLVIPQGVTDLACVFYNFNCLKSATIPISVTSIASSAFYGCSGLTSVTIPNSVTSIEYEAFYNCSSLTSVTIPNSVTSIGRSAFYGCSGLTSVTIPNSVTSIGDDAFEGCSSLTSVTIPNSVTSIGYWAFSGCSGLTSVTIPNSVTSIGNGAFSGCSGLTSVTIPNSVTSISQGAFAGCSGLKSISLSNSIKSIDPFCFRDCSCLTSITIPNNVQSIDDDAFSGCTALTTVVLGTQMGNRYINYGAYIYTLNYNIDYNAFANCPELTDVYCYATSVPRLGSNVFKGSMPEYATLHVRSNLIEEYNATGTGWEKFGSIVALKAGDPGLSSDTTPIVFADAAFGAAATAKWDFDGNGRLSVYEALIVENSGNAFENNEDIKSIDDLKYFKNMTILGTSAFKGCTGLTSVTIPGNMRAIGNLAFGNCENLSSVYISDLEAWCSIKFGSSVYDTPSYYSNVPSLAFYDTPHSLYLNGKEIKQLVIPNSVTSIGDGVFEECNALTSVIIPNTVKSIGEGAFACCDGLTSITIPKSVKSLGKWAFWGCNGLTSVIISDGVTSIEMETFRGCSGLTSVTIPNSVTSIGKNAFYNCTGLQEVRSMIKVPFTIVSSVFPNYNIPLYVPRGTKTLYEATDGWKKFKTIIETDFNEQPKGDLNLDSQVNGTDVVALVNVIMQGGNNSAADVNGDGKVNGTDIVALVNIVMQTSLSREMAVAGSRGGEEAEDCNATAAIGAALTPTGTDGSQELAISLTNPAMDVTMVQMDVTLPEGVTLDDDAATMGGRTTGRSHQLYASHLDERTVRLLLVSGHNALIAGTEGDIVRLPLTVGDGFQGGDIVVDHALCTSPDQTEAWPQAVVLHLAEDGTMGIGSVGMAAGENVSVHSLTGQRLAAPRKGVNIVNGKKIIVK